MACYQQIGSFEIRTRQQSGMSCSRSAALKVGGNVATYFCTADGRVLHSVAGPVSAETLLVAAHWAKQVSEEIQGMTETEQSFAMMRLHGEYQQHELQPSVNPQFISWWDPHSEGHVREIHNHLALKGLLPFDEVYRDIFEGILGERVDSSDTPLYDIDRKIEAARRSRLPLLIHVYDAGQQDPVGRWQAFLQSHYSTSGRPDLIAWMLERFEIFHVSQQQFRGLLERQSWEPTDIDLSDQPLFVVVDCNQEMLLTTAGWREAGRMQRELAFGLLPSLQYHPLSESDFHRLQPRFAALDPELAEDLHAIKTSGHLPSEEPEQEPRAVIIDGVPLRLEEEPEAEPESEPGLEEEVVSA